MPDLPRHRPQSLMRTSNRCSSSHSISRQSLVVNSTARCSSMNHMNAWFSSRAPSWTTTCHHSAKSSQWIKVWLTLRPINCKWRHRDLRSSTNHTCSLHHSWMPPLQIARISLRVKYLTFNRRITSRANACFHSNSSSRTRQIARFCLRLMTSRPRNSAIMKHSKTTKMDWDSTIKLLQTSWTWAAGLNRSPRL